MHKHLDALAMGILVLLCFSWGLQQVAIKVALPEVPPVLQGGIRSIGAMVLLVAWMHYKGVAILARDGTFWWGMAAGLLFAGEFLLIYWGLEFTLASRAVIFLYLSPFVVAIGSQLFIPGEQLRWMQVAGLVCAFAGILVAFGESFSVPDSHMLLGDTMLVAAAVLWGATTVLIKAGPLARIAASKTLAYQLGVSALLLPVGSLLLAEGGITTLSSPVLASLAFQSLWVAFVTYLVWFWLIRSYSAARLASFTFLTPLFGVLAGGWFLNEPLTVSLWTALALVGSGIYMVNRPVPDTKGQTRTDNA